MRISDWSSDVCSSDLVADHLRGVRVRPEDVVVEEAVPVESRLLGDLWGTDRAVPHERGDTVERTRSRGELLERDRKSVAEGKSVSVRVDLGGRRINKKKTNIANKMRHTIDNHT